MIATVLLRSYFDLSVYQHGADILDHLAGAYALSLASFLKAQACLPCAIDCACSLKHPPKLLHTALACLLEAHVT